MGSSGQVLRRRWCASFSVHQWPEWKRRMLCVAVWSEEAERDCESAIIGWSQRWWKVATGPKSSLPHLFFSLTKYFLVLQFYCLKGESLMELAPNIIPSTISHLVTPWLCIFMRYFCLFAISPSAYKTPKPFLKTSSLPLQFYTGKASELSQGPHMI